MDGMLLIGLRVAKPKKYLFPYEAQKKELVYNKVLIKILLYNSFFCVLYCTPILSPWNK